MRKKSLKKYFPFFPGIVGKLDRTQGSGFQEWSSMNPQFPGGNRELRRLSSPPRKFGSFFLGLSRACVLVD